MDQALDYESSSCGFDSHRAFQEFTGDWQRWLMHSPLKRDQAGSIPASPTRVRGIGRCGYALAF